MIDWLEHHLAICFFKSYFGVDCPTCGMQRSFIALLKGDPIGSFKYHPALIPLILSFILLGIQLKLKSEHGYKVVIWAFVITFSTLIIHYILRISFS